MNKYLLFMLAVQCCSSCMCMKKSAYDKFEINIQDFASKRHELKEYKELLGMLDYTLQDTLIQLIGCETVAQKSQRKQNRNYLEHGEEIAATVQHFATESAAKYKEAPSKWLPLTNERGIGHAVGKHGILVDLNSGNMTIHNAMNIYKYIQNHGEVKTVYDRMLEFADSVNKRNYITRILEYCALIHATKNSECYVKHTYKYDIAPEIVKSEIKEYEGEKIRVDCTGLAFLVKDLDYNDGSDIYALFIPVHHAYSDESGLKLMAAVASIYPLRNCTELWFKLNPRVDSKRNDDFVIPAGLSLTSEFLASLPFIINQTVPQPTIKTKEESAKKPAKKAKTVKKEIKSTVNDSELIPSADVSQQRYRTKFINTNKPGEILLHGRKYRNSFIFQIDKTIAREGVLSVLQSILDMSKDAQRTELQRKELSNFASRLQTIYDANIDNAELYTQIYYITASFNYQEIKDPIRAMIQISARYGFTMLFAELFLDLISDDFFTTREIPENIIESSAKSVNDMIATKSTIFKKKYDEAKNRPHCSTKLFGDFRVELNGQKETTATKLMNDFQEYRERHSTLLAYLKQELPTLVYSATVIGGIQIDEEAWKNIEFLKPFYQSIYKRIQQAILDYKIKSNIELMNTVRQTYKSKEADKFFDARYINEIDTHLKFLLIFIKTIIDAKKYDTATKNALNNIRKYATQLYENHIGHLIL